MQKQNINTLADFKRALNIGANVHCLFHKERARDENNNLIYVTVDKGVRKVSIKQTNSFALLTTKADGSQVDSWCAYPKASETKIENNEVTIYESDRDNNLSPVLTYTILQD